jgi:hypothetical protein
MRRKTVLGLVLAAALLMPTVSMAASGNHLSRSSSSWWQELISWIVQTTGLHSVRGSDQKSPPTGATSDARTIIDPEG